MPRYIDADKIPYRFYSFYAGDELMVRKDVIDQMPTLSPDKVRGMGKWIENACRIKCSVCGTDFNDEVTCCSDCYRWPWNYCPNCGAKMKGADDGTTDNS